MALIRSQQAWLRFRDLESGFLLTTSRYGSPKVRGSVVVSDRLRELLSYRVRELQEYLHIRINNRDSE